MNAEFEGRSEERDPRRAYRAGRCGEWTGDPLAAPGAGSSLRSGDDRVVDVYPDPEAGREAFTYQLESGSEDTIHLDAVLEYHEDPAYLNEVLLHRLTVEARKTIEHSDMPKRELVRRLGTSPSQLYRLLDPANSAKSAGQLLALLHLLGCEVDVVVRPAVARGAVSRPAKRKPGRRSSAGV